MDNFSQLMRFERTGRENSTKYTYVDIEITNSSGTDQFINYTESRTSTYVDNASDYYLSIVRFILPTFHLPLFIPLILDPSSDPNQSIYSFTMQYKTYVKQTYLDYVSPNSDIPTPSLSQSQQMNTDYYYVYSYNYVVTMLNDTLQTCYNDLKELVEAGSDTIAGNDHIPFFLFDPASKSLVLYANKDAFDSGLSNPVYIYCNEAMYNLLAGFEYIRNRKLGNGRDYRFNLTQSLSNLSYFDDYTAIVQSEEFSSVSNWSPISSIVFCTNLPIAKTLVSKPSTFGTSNFSGSLTSNSKAIITDISVGDFMDSKLIYSPFFLREIDLIGNDSIDTIDLTIYYKDRYGIMYPYILPNNSSCFIKVAFVRKY